MEKHVIMLNGEDANSFCKLFILFLLFNIVLNSVHAQNFHQRDFENIKLYPLPFPKQIDWGHDLINDGTYLPGIDTIANGTWKQNYEGKDSKLARVFTIKDGKLNGKHIFFDLDGNLSNVDFYDKGLVFARNSYYKNNILKDSTRLFNNVPVYFCKWDNTADKTFEGTQEVQSYFVDGKKILTKIYSRDNLAEVEYASDNGNVYYISFKNGTANKYCILKTVNGEEKFKYKKLPRKIKDLIKQNYFN